MKKLILTALLSVGLIATQAEARGWDKHHNGYGENRGWDKHHTRYDYARVMAVEPMIQRIERRVPRESCWTERVPGRRYSSRDSSMTDELIGGLIGGAIGNAVGHNKSNKKVQAVIGAAIGASIAHDLNRPRHRDYDVGYRDEQRCAVEHDVEYHEEITGYHVTYRYLGRDYQTQMRQHPGKKIKVQVGVRPVH